MNFFADENIAERAVPLLRAFDNRGHTFVYLLEWFAKGTDDLDWLPVVVSWDPRPVILSGDGGILTDPKERPTLRRSGCSFVYFGRTWTNTPWEAYAYRLIRYWPDIRARVEALTRPTIVEVTINGRIHAQAV